MTILPKVSVMIIAYNQKSLISETIESVLQQDYEKLEIVIADDASTDGTQLVLQEYASKYPGKFVLMLNKKNLGITRNCNIALSACTGELIAVLGGDDLFLPGKISAQVSVFVDHPEVNLSYHAVEVFQHQTGKILDVTNSNPKGDIKNIKDMLTKLGIPGGSSLMHRRSAIPLGGYDERLPMVSDWLFMLELALSGEIKKLDGVYARYRKHGQGASDRTLEFLEESLRNVDLFLEKHPERADLTVYCDRAKARYIAGEAFRQLRINREVAEKLLIRSVSLDRDNRKYLILLAISKVPMLAGIAGYILHLIKAKLKSLAL